MATVDSQTQQGVSAEIDPTFRALRVITRPFDYQLFSGGGVSRVLGHYRAGASTVSGLLASNAILGTFRYTDTSSFAIITRISIGVTVTAAITAQRTDPISVTVARAYTAPDATNATVLVSSGNNQKMRTTMGSANAVIAVASNVAGMSGGTKVLDANPEEFVTLQNLVAIGSGTPMTDAYNLQISGAHPIVHAANEGFIVSWGATAIGGSGAAYVTIAIDWAEVAVF